MTLTPQANYLKFTHANFNAPVWVARGNIFAFYHSKTHACTHIVGPGTSLIPVLETEDEVLTRLQETHGKPTEGPVHQLP